MTILVAKDENSGVPIRIQIVGKRDRKCELIATAALLESFIKPWGNRKLAQML